MTTRPTLTVEVVSDAICPWCWIGKHRLDRALAALQDEIRVKVSWRPFELNPGMPKAGVARREYRERKFGSWERSQALDANVAAAGRADGLEFRHDLIERTPNTLDAHRLIWLAGQHGVQAAVVEALFVAYFREGRDIGEQAVLTQVGAAAGLEATAIERMLCSWEGESEVAAELKRAASLGISGVPSVVARGRVLFSGALEPARMQEHLRGAMAGA
jgi:predicted DsbA family dithiol-disulfide isomerase